VNTNRWQGLLDILDASSGGGDVYYLKQPKTRIRLLLPSMSPAYVPEEGNAEDDDDTQFFAETTKYYQDQARTNFLIFALILGTSEKSDQNVSQTKVRAIRLPKTALRGIVGQLAEDWDLFDPKGGHGLVIEKIGGANSERTSYNIQVSPKPVPVDPGALEWPNKDLWQIAEDETARSLERNSKKASGKSNGRNRPQVIEDDEDLPF
jgi:hypothetical protein